MNQVVKKVIDKYFRGQVSEIKNLGGGFYGKVFLASIDKPPHEVVVKIYSDIGMAKKEGLQLSLLAEHTLIPMPRVYYVHEADVHIDHDVLMMEFLTGVNAGFQDKVNEAYLDHIGESMVDNLIAYHSTTNPKGFGEVDTDGFVGDWRLFYRPKVESIMNSALTLYKNGALDEPTYKIVLKAFDKFDEIFYLPITTSGLIHGDYNTWNIMLNEEKTETVAVIDPFGCCWADPEYDLYQLNNANGQNFKLLDRYKRKLPVSENFDLKICFYELFSEIMHYHDAEVDLADSDIPATAAKLEALMAENGIIIPDLYKVI